MSLSNILLIPGIVGAVDELRALFFGAGQRGGLWIPGHSGSCFQDTSGTTFCTDNTPCARMNDLSGNGNHFLQSTGSLQPLFRTNDGTYIQGDGIDDRMTVNIDFSNSDQMTIITAIRKLSDAADQNIVELTIGGVNGWAGLYAPGSGGVARFQYNTRGTIGAFPFTSSATYNAPISAVVTGQSRISTDLATLRVNGVQVASVATDQGTGNYANSSVNLLRRSAGTNPSNSRLAFLLMVGGNYSASAISRGEVLASRFITGVTI
jgi:hypothetical protein